ncbi:DUF4401 domain-containing protein [Shewanella sp. WXL01]|uniref:DUF4401 domain-containing protein n=1 Tax=Shewanella sp. WXL01 TaxID=2709721 RepID=UPI0014383D9A|nr:DUF4401 domain-containing protein [Shewanella sp. WXL01]NKF49177.1 DUF4401 domain-containing protein [Shewanella sp. WXL01]
MRQALEMWQQLYTLDLVTGDKPTLCEDVDSPWFVKLLLAAAGWLAALFLLGFIFLSLSFLLEEDALPFIVGPGIILAAGVLFARKGNEFYEHLALALSLTGQAVLMIGFAEHFDTKACFVIASIVQFGLILLMPNAIHRFCSAALAGMCLMASMSLWGLPYLAEALLFALASYLILTEFDLYKRPLPRWYQLFAASSAGYHRMAVAYGLLFISVLQTCFLVFEYNWIKQVSFRYSEAAFTSPWMGDLLMGLVALFITRTILSRYSGIPVTVRAAVLIIIGLLAMLTMQAHGLIVGVLVMLLGMSASNNLLIGAGVLALVSFMSAYYYWLDVSLVVKSGILLVTGALLLIVRWGMLRYVAVSEQVGANMEESNID